MVRVGEQVWSTDQRSYVRLLGSAIGVSPRGRSARLERVLTDFGCEHSFENAASRVLEHYGFEIGYSAVRDTTLEHAQRARQILEQQYKGPYRLLPANGAAQVIAEAEGSLVRLVEPGKRKEKRARDWKEIRLCAAQAQGKADTIYAATFADVHEVGCRWGHCARSAGWGLNSHVHALGDGAEWIRRQTREVFGGQASFLCDFFHVSEYLAEAAQTCRREAPDQWRRIQQKRLKRGVVDKVIEALSAHLEPAEAPDEIAPARNAHRYLSHRLDCLDYPRALALGLPIGSGMIESGHRHVLQARLKKAGAAWLMDSAERIANLRVLRANRQWESMWN